jgi:hypothetical protein
MEQRMNSYQAVVMVDGRVVKTLIYADTAHNAKRLLERQYGRGSVVGFLQQIH